MLPVIAIVGRPNVGKSTLFNCLTKTRDAIVADMPGVTRDRQYGEGQVGDKPYLVIDTGGIGGDEVGIDGFMAEQTVQAIGEADVILFMVDARDGMNASDQAIAQQLRRAHKTVQLVVNKVDGLDEDIALSEFYALGLGQPTAISAAHNRGIVQLAEGTLSALPMVEALPEAEEKGIKIAMVGRPNVGKSTLVNRMLGEPRVIVYDQAGTTRDSIYVPLERRNQHYTLIDTAGVRRRGRIGQALEKFSVVKSLQAIKDAHVVIMLVDGQEGLAEQDLKLLGFVLDMGRALVIAVNKWDGLDSDQRDTIKRELDRRLRFVEFAKTRFISALHGTGVGDLFDDVHQAYRSAFAPLSASKLTDWLEQAMMAHQPPMVRGRRIKLRFAHPGGSNPPTVVIHGNQVDSVPASYTRYLVNFFSKKLKLVGSPLRVVFRGGDNPFAGRKNTLTPRQQHKRSRMIKFVRKKK